ncbi:hypothetical protein U9M48_040671 [Paspalum notatum var. saurae]|uniref:Uncharacterized protein n=1 Tax=Paspalum notatum var. saurae TaxID=547442 RepID=A0AAQ3XFT2_PASNO
MCLVPAESAPGDRAAGRGMAESRGADGREAGGRGWYRGAEAGRRAGAGAVEALRRRRRRRPSGLFGLFGTDDDFVISVSLLPVLGRGEWA